MVVVVRTVFTMIIIRESLRIKHFHFLVITFPNTMCMKKYVKTLYEIKRGYQIVIWHLVAAELPQLL